jgi:hypothetical protein
MRLSRINGENSQVSDGRRAIARKCRDCDNAAVDRRVLCPECSTLAFDIKAAQARERYMRKAHGAKREPISDYIRGIMGYGL